MFGLFTKSAKPQSPAMRPDQVGCFGKMPIHGDFIRHNVQGREVAAFEKWIQEGISLVSRKHPGVWPEAYRTFPNVNFVLVGGEQERTLAGALVASQDKSGRHYPFSILIAAEDRLFTDMQAIAPYVFQNFFQETTDICCAHWAHEPLPLLTGRVDGMSRRDTGLNPRRLFESQFDALKTISMGEFWETALPGAGASDRERLFNTLFSALKTVMRRGPTRTGWGLRLPLPDTGDQTPFVMFWLQLIEANLEDRCWRAHYFWNRADQQHPASLAVFFRPLPGSFLLPLLNPSLDDGSIFDVTRESATPSETRCNLDFKKLLARNDAPMIDVLYKAGRGGAVQ